MTHDWLLVETLGSEPVVVARGLQTKNLVPISVFLRRNPHLMAIQSAIRETVQAGQGLSSITPKNDRVIRTEVVRMSDGHIHGVHVWIGPADAEPPQRPVPGPLVWDLTAGVATDTAESLHNSGMNPETEATHDRAFADDLPSRDLNGSESKVLAMTIKPVVGNTLCTTWDVTDHRGEAITVGFVARVVTEPHDDGSDRLICRAMNWRSERETPVVRPDNLAQRILDGLARPGVHRALVGLDDWKLLKWLDEPAPFFDWRNRDGGPARIHPADARHMARMTTDFSGGATTAVLRMRTEDGGWQPVHMTINRIELDDNTFAGLIALRLPTDDEVAAADLDGLD
ncbi:PAS domain-containing protein [Mycolicibacterium septicum]|uniref:PAS domain-containing protein n=1 Tax=Mycolicibacterium septicum TaxID=98668 RepID=A0ABW9LQ57_9MYCO